MLQGLEAWVVLEVQDPKSKDDVMELVVLPSSIVTKFLEELYRNIVEKCGNLSLNEKCNDSSK